MESYDKSLDKYINEIVDNIDLVVGEIYLITNTINNKKYVGQTMSHHKNHLKYRPYGYKGRFASHISEARRDVDKNTYLKQSIRKHGEDAFTLQLVKRCILSEIDNEEQLYIKKYNTLYPEGYNLTIGGKLTRFIKVKVEDDKYIFDQMPLYRTFQTEETREKISNSLQKSFADENIRLHRSKMTQDQHNKKRLELFKNCKIDPNDDYNKYLSKKNRWTVKIDGIETRFDSSHDSDEMNKQRAIDFIKYLMTQRHDQIAGTPLEL